jgi:ATPase family protein associated with various cellular activities (AAA)
MIDTRTNLELLVRARYALIVLETIEPELAERMVRQIASDLQLHYYSWTRSKGLRRGPSGGVSAGEPYADDAKEPHKALACAEREGAGIFFFRELGPFLEDPLVASHVLDLVSAFGTKRGALIITGQDIRLPDALRPHATTLRLAGPVYDDYRTMLERVIRDQTARMPVQIELTPQDRVRLINNLAGLTLIEAEKVVTKLLIEDAALRPNDIQRVIDAKRQAVEQDGLLEYFPAEEGLSSVAGLAGLKSWLTKRRTVVTDPHRAVEFGLSFPKGMLLLGVPGCGKSLCAKSVAREWGLPLLKLDPANLYDKYVGDSEKNFKRAMQTAERLAPIVLWIDELEKAFAGGSGEEDGGVSRRVFGTFLSWLQDRKGDVFVVATSNDVAKLPPEFIRKGRFDEIFFVDLPKPDVRAAIFGIHLRKRKQDVGRFDLAALAAATEGFSGAEIEETVVAGLYTAFSGSTELTTDGLLAEIRRTRPLSRTMSERLDALRQWASDRTVAAD